MAQDNQTFLKDALHKLRLRLLDLTNRNSLLNFRHSEKSLTHIRIIDELPDFLFGSFLKGESFTFHPLPEPDDEPHDEKTEKFQTYFREATLTDEQYLQEITELIDKDDSFDDLAVIERNLKNRVREQLGMPRIEDLKPLSNAKWARENGLEPNYDMPEPSEDDFSPERHIDDKIQTLLKPKELRHKLSGLRRYINSDINESGVNTFFAAFGFLERYDNESSDRPLLAPLVLLQLDPPFETKMENGEIYYGIQAAGEDPQYNLPLAEKLKEFGLTLPKLAEDDTPESYMSKVKRLISNQPRWRVRRFITLGRFPFSRLVMYHDLYPERWPASKSLERHSIISKLIAGIGESSNTNISEEAQIYNIDTDPEVERVAPVLITEADSSQHSAIVDAMKGSNLVIKGPPGTGKSQTITNLIANALSKGKKVLFIAEKMAALNVVHSRLQDAGLGDHCLELHSTKAKLKDLKEDLAKTIENRKEVSRPPELQQRISEIKEAQERLREYSDVINQPLGESGKTIHKILWGEQRRRTVAENLPVSVKTLEIKNALSFSEQKLELLCKDLNELESLEKQNNAYSGNRHPWTGVTVSQAGSLKTQEIIQAFEESLASIENLVKQFNLIEDEFQWTTNRTIAEWKQVQIDCLKLLEFRNRTIQFEVLKNLKSPKALPIAEKLAEILKAYDHAIASISSKTKDLTNLIENAKQISDHCEKAKVLKINNLTLGELGKQLQRQSNQIKLWRRIADSLEIVGPKILGSNANLTDFKIIRSLIKGVGVLEKVDRGLLFLRNEEVINEANNPIFSNGLTHQKKLQKIQVDLEKQFDLNFKTNDQDLNDAVYQLATANFWSFFRPKYYKAWKTFRSTSLTSNKLPAEKAANCLRQLIAFKEELSTFENNTQYKKIAGKAFNGLQTNFEGLISVNAWATNVRQELGGLEETNNQIKHFLFNAEVAELEAVIKEIGQISSKLSLGDIPHGNEISLSEYIEKQQINLQQKKRAYKFLEGLQGDQNLTYKTLGDLLNGPVKSATKYINFLKENIQTFQNILGRAFKGEKTDRELLSATLAFHGHLTSLKLPDHLDNIILSSQFFQFAENLNGLLQNLGPAIDDAEQKLKTLQSVSGLDVNSYIGTDKFLDAPLKKLFEALQTSLKNQEALNAQLCMRAFLVKAQSQPYDELLEALKNEGLDYQNSSQLFEYLFYRTLCREAFGNHSILDNYNPHWLSGLQKGYKDLDKKIIKLNCQELAWQLSQTQPPEGNSQGRVSEYTEMGLIRHQALKERTRAIPIRKLVNRAGNALQALKPCFLMSPLSVAQYIAPHSLNFDLVVIDEASQMRPEDALGAIARSSQIVVVGDPEQLPPTAFFSKQSFKDSDYDEEDNIDNESILDLSLGRFRPTRDLLWHYRSRHESLIAFSNKRFYQDRLIIFPSPEDRSKGFGVHCHFVGGTYNASCNIDETKAVMEAAQKFMRENPNKSLGIATMNSQQRDLIDEEMYRLFLNDEAAEAYRQKWEDTLEPLFVKNLESVQGDERDAIFISTVYGPNKDGQVMQRFGPINGKHGHRRLNVLFTRAKHNLVLFTSLRPDNIRASETSSRGLRAFKGYLEYAFEGKLEAGSYTGREPDSDFEICVKERLESIGCEVVPQVGVAGYFIDLGVRHPNFPYGFLLGIECDGATYHSSKSARDRDRIRQEVLEGLGWEIYRIWSTDWFHNPLKEFEKVKKHIEESLNRKLSEREQRERDRLSSIRNLQQHMQDQPFSEPDEEGRTESENTSVFAPPGQSISSNGDNVELFDTVSYQSLDDQPILTKVVTIVPSQSDPDSGIINQHSAIGRALMGSQLNDEVEVELPDGSRTIQIIKIEKNKNDQMDAK